MRKGKLLKSGAGLLVLAVFLFCGATSVHALPMDLKNVEVRGASNQVWYQTPSSASWGTLYELQASNLSGYETWATSFCVDPTPLKTGATNGWTLEALSSENEKNAAKLAAWFFDGGSDYSQSAFQVAIWYEMNMIDSFNTLTTGTAAKALWESDSWHGYDFSGFAIATNDDNQNQLVNVPEPATMLLLGLGMIGLGFSRGKSYARNRAFEHPSL